MSLQANFAEARFPTSGNSGTANELASELLRLFDEARDAVENQPDLVPGIVDRLLKRIASTACTATACSSGGLAPWQQRRIAQFLRENLARGINTRQLAIEAKLSVSHFCRAFKKSFGETPHAYVVRQRLEMAQKLMLDSQAPLSQIALSCGLADQAHLSKLFRRLFHDTPNAWRRRNLTEEGAIARYANVQDSMQRAA
jgi:AraC family transcriptional regulator